MANEHDLRYRKLFSSPRIMQELLESFVDEPWVAELDFTTAERMDRSFITEGFKERESDLIWKLRFKGETVYLYLLMEFQSTVDRFMALRVLRYVVEFYQHLVDSQHLVEGNRLPAVFPLVLYNGDSRWTAPEELGELIDVRIGREFMPAFRYFKLAENEIPDATLEQLNNLVGALFLVETMDPEELATRVESIVGMLKSEHEEEIGLFGHWLANFFGNSEHPLTVATGNLKEVRDMLATKLKQKEIEWTERGREEGLEKGREKGREEGREEGVRETALRLKSLGMSTEVIMKATGLTREAIEKL
jgi:predicted transposase/invertase (TIGR01784 family)